MAALREFLGLVRLPMSAAVRRLSSRPVWPRTGFGLARGARRDGALLDTLTCLGNRRLLHQHALAALSEPTEPDQTRALFLFDLDDFKRINDTLGHQAGDRVLVEVARRTRESLGEEHLAVRLGGDEFAVLTAPLPDIQSAERLADRVLAALRPPVVLDEIEISVQASMGIALHDADGTTLEELLRAADQAMYEAKTAGPVKWRRNPAGSRHRHAATANLLRELRGALASDQLVIHYQPQVDSQSARVVGFEALVRWQHPVRGLLPPKDFLALAERSGLARRITLLVLDQALRDHRRLRALAPDVSMAVNVSARNLLEHGLLTEIERHLVSSAVAASELTLEIVEPAPHPAPAMRDLFAGLRRLGCQVSIHEFGAGPSSLAALSHYPAVREIKIDPDLVRASADDEESARLIRAMVNAAHGLDVRVVAEGVEDLESVVRLRALGCDVLQGFWVARPASLPDLEAWLADWNRVGAERLGL